MGVAALLNLQENLETELNMIDNADEQIAALKNRLDEVEKQLYNAAKKLSQTRISAQSIVTKHLIEQLKTLNMPHIRFDISITEKTDFSNRKQLIQISEILSFYSGTTPVYLYDGALKKTQVAKEKLWVTVNRNLTDELEELLGKDHVRVVSVEK